MRGDDKKIAAFCHEFNVYYEPLDTNLALHKSSKDSQNFKKAVCSFAGVGAHFFAYYSAGVKRTMIDC